MQSSHNLPSAMCPGCAYYEFRKGHSDPHACKESGSFTNHGKCGQHPDRDGTASSCNAFKPR